MDMMLSRTWASLNVVRLDAYQATGGFFIAISFGIAGAMSGAGMRKAQLD
ncbi:hypothetical protein [Chromobacterium violaceum]|uniref:Uncharacterized protein n=1 Tax=Chromobacterium violaceum TaxID=536 RepID=A0AAX2MF17_CHRVL|nr:hypothetical protein [Chromobacterium violaceum]STB69740.1 Uncharacterised protein [Chromobacterium violaceum]SUY92980.1 Uncharacterised protein [Chromobacterium violaceum]